MTEPALLVLEDGTVFEGDSVGAKGIAVGEVVFNTAMTGYQEILTDPSYVGQLVTLTSPHIGNTGCNDDDQESTGAAASGLIVRDVPQYASHWRQSIDLPQWLAKRNVVAITQVDTRKLTRLLRSHGAQNGVILAGETDLAKARAALDAFPGLNGQDLAKTVSTQRPYGWTEGVISLGTSVSDLAGPHFHVIVYDFGVKQMMLRLLRQLSCRVSVVPATTPFDSVLSQRPDGVFFSNGPGDPQPCSYAIEAVQQCIAHGIPLFGICLGHQLLALALGGQTVKMTNGHHGANHPVKDLDSNRVMITSQNHGFAVDEASLPSRVRVTHRSLFDGSNQGIALKDAPAFSFQGHPEASPGPSDATHLFRRFIAAMEARL